MSMLFGHAETRVGLARHPGSAVGATRSADLCTITGAFANLAYLREGWITCKAHVLATCCDVTAGRHRFCWNHDRGDHCKARGEAEFPYSFPSGEPAQLTGQWQTLRQEVGLPQTIQS